MRELILKMSMTVDGFVSDLDGSNRWMYGSDPQSKAWAVETTWNASLHIMGSRSFLAMAGFWPTSTMEFAPPMNQIPKAVFSRQGPAILRNVPSTSGNWAQAYVASGDLAQEI
ncbi:MAG TPA: dihydrofolate reductase family protein, partial [Steroidobacteraceae bacterium]|nr:dihydrofolate reductase family protein [Steroidobacteraceae bacterium]